MGSGCRRYRSGGFPSEMGRHVVRAATAIGVRVRVGNSVAYRSARVGAGGASVAMAVCVALGVGGTAAHAQRAVPSPSKHAVVLIYYQSTAEFMAVKRRRPAGFDWGDDGCSVPPSLRVALRTLRYAARMFADECRQHDFAYRNFGGRMGLDRSEAQRAVVDRHFYEQMKLRCRRALSGRVQRAMCRLYARAFYMSVRAFGHL